MSRPQTQAIREFILDCVASSPRSIARQVAQAYGISRQAANRHLDVMVAEGLLEQQGYTRSKEYRLRRMSTLNRELRVTPVLNPDRLWDDHIAPVLHDDRPAIRDLCHGAFCELIQNVIGHAHAAWVTVSFATTARHVDIMVGDDGRGIFHELAEKIGVRNPREAADLMADHANARSTDFPAARLLLLARNFEWLEITSSGVTLTYDAGPESWSVAEGESAGKGTKVSMRLGRGSKARNRINTRALEEAFSR
ncbi:MAG TPA: hypothetical protein VFH88_01235 [Candidatus Krumholzibacteria bacterium]|nr:hypothetical protein [Candidatus Krumholzibacteria bacterium]